jgi:hypothetical protein
MVVVCGFRSFPPSAEQQTSHQRHIRGVDIKFANITAIASIIVLVLAIIVDT